MPFIGRDWRSPGEAWVKTESLGWQRMKLIESQLFPICHQDPACSWPPRSEYGQHMASNCNAHRRDSRDNTSSPGSSDSGRGNSVSPSPSCSPEKNSHHLFPLTISSPYGSYSYCNHQADSNGQRSERPADNETTAQSIPKAQCDKSRRPCSMFSHRKLNWNDEVNLFASDKTPTKIIISSEAQSSQTKQQPSARGNESNQREQSNQSSNGYPLRESSNIKVKLESQASGQPNNDISQRYNPIDDMTAETSSCKPSQQSNVCCNCCKTDGSATQGHRPSNSLARNAPYCPISVRTREVAMYNTISEAFYRLDFCNAVHDIRRFNYICKLLHLLITQSLTSLSGCASKVLFTILEQVACEGKLYHSCNIYAIDFLTFYTNY